MPSYTQRTYHNAVISTLNRKAAWAKEVDAYPNTSTERALNTPALYFDIEGWERAESGTEQLNLDLECVIWVVVSRSLATDGSPELYTRTLAEEISVLIDTETFGLDVEPAEFLSTGVDNFDRALLDYHVWRVDFRQILPVGADPYANLPGLTQIFLGREPKVGTGHEDDYTPMLPESPEEV